MQPKIDRMLALVSMAHAGPLHPPVSHTAEALLLPQRLRRAASQAAPPGADPHHVPQTCLCVPSQGSPSKQADHDVCPEYAKMLLLLPSMHENQLATLENV